jgi:O-antigen/teichoic acid export membrane protein
MGYPLMHRAADAAPSEKIGRRTTTGAGLLISSNVVARLVDLAALTMLARLLSPADFGLVAIAMSVMMIVEAVMELPLGLALVALPERTKAHFDTVFTVGLLRGAVLALILILTAWPLAKIYHDNRLIALLCVLGLAPASSGLASPRMAEYAIKMDFKPNFAMDVISRFATFAVSVSVAWLTGSYWSLALGTLASPLTLVVVSFIYAPYLPSLTLSKWRDFSGYLRWTTLTQLLTATNWQMDQLLLGRLVSRQELGAFSMASNLSAVPGQILIVQAAKPLLAGFSLVRNDLRRLASAYQKSVNGVVAVGLPLLAGIWFTATPLIRLALGNQWSEAVPLLQWLSIAAMPSLFVSPVWALVMALNKPNIFFRLALSEFIIKLPLMLVGVFSFGILGALGVRVMTAVFATGCSMWFVRALIKLPIGTQLLIAWRPTLGVVIMAFTCEMLGWDFLNPQDHGQLILSLIWILGIGGTVYVGSLLLLWFLAGRPDGIEAKALEVLGNLLRRSLTIRAWRG